MNSSNAGDRLGPAAPTGPLREVPVDWEALEDAFENNAPEVHSYLHLATGEVLRVVDGVADPQMHVRIASDGNYLRIDPVSSREQYRWMERFIPMVDDTDLRGKLGQAIDGKGAFRRFKDVLMNFADEREKWFVFRSERLRTFMEAWLGAHAIKAAIRPAWADDTTAPRLERRRAQVEERAPHPECRNIASNLEGAWRGPRPAGPRDAHRLCRVSEGPPGGARVRTPSRTHDARANHPAQSQFAVVEERGRRFFLEFTVATAGTGGARP
jgi:hypothetical protein